jgi:Zn-dependent protease
MPDITPEIILSAFIWYVVFLFSTTCHEAAHAIAAKLQGDETAAKGGQITLNPFPHIRREPYGMVLVPILSVLISGGTSLFGWASAPFDPDWARRYPRRSAIMALAGPLANFTLMSLAVAGIYAGANFGLFQNEAWGPFARHVLIVFFALNLLLGIFNLVPAPPLDGSAAIMLFMSEERARRYLDWLHEGNFGLIALLITIVGFRYIYPFIEAPIVSLLLPRYF